ncbi:MAG: adenylate/guanylate cyclase domain-containing protein [Azospirillaceae bacterium]|nr:adenylate/guanylate cyclase domain-containing protein [Azospirillaceae bacterium]
MSETTQALEQSARGCPIRRSAVRLSIATALLLGFGTLVLVAVASVLILGFSTSTRNTAALLTDKVILAMDGMTVRVRAQLDPAQYQAEFLVASIARGEIDTTDTARLGQNLRSALAASPQITAVSFVSPEGKWTVARRTGRTEAEVSTMTPPPATKVLMEEMKAAPIARWVDPVWSTEGETSYLTVRAPVRAADGTFLGAVLVGVSFVDLSGFLGELDSSQGVTAFILYDADHVLAHPALIGRTFDLADRTPPLPTLADLGDPVAAGIWQRQPPGHVVARDGMGGKLRDLDFRQATVGDVDYVYLLRDLTGYGARSWTLVMALPQREVDQEIRRVRWFGLGGVAILLVSVVLSLILGKTISRQIRGLSRAATSLRDLDFHAVPYLPDSRLSELSDAAAAFNTMLTGLRWFESYVPKALVLRLIRRGDHAGSILSEERDVTVMFTDIKGFSTLAQNMTPAQTASLLNEHFTLLSACIEAEGGTVDKFIGDAVMAFWGAPDDQADHAARALRAAAAISRCIRHTHDEAMAQGRPAICLRVGIHSGPVVVGNIGTASRINYTIVGDTVNAAARLEALGADLAAEAAPCIVLASADTVDAAGDCGVAMTDVGEYSLRGRTGQVRVWQLADGDHGPSDPVGPVGITIGEAGAPSVTEDCPKLS